MALPTLYKYHGLGNDFLITQALDEPEAMKRLAQELCPRHTAFGADGVLFWSMHVDGRPQMIIYNCDGTRPEMCGNGLRCLALFLVQHHHVEQSDDSSSVHVEVHTDDGVKACIVDPSEGHCAQVTVDMGVPMQIPGELPLDDQGQFPTWFGVDMGNPHAVVMHQPTLAVIDAVGHGLNDIPAHPSFEAGVNVEFVSRRDDNVYDVVVFERGVGRTQACGTGACAVAWSMWQTGAVSVEDPVTVWLPGGPLVLSLEPNGAVTMKGPAQWVYAAQLPG